MERLGLAFTKKICDLGVGGFEVAARFAQQQVGFFEAYASEADVEIGAELVGRHRSYLVEKRFAGGNGLFGDTRDGLSFQAGVEGIVDFEKNLLAGGLGSVFFGEGPFFGAAG